MSMDQAHCVGAGNLDARYLELDPRPVDVLAIGSQLAYGSVGLNAAVPVYEAAGLRCAAVPTTILSVLPHYPSMHRADLSTDWLWEVLHDLDLSGALRRLRTISVGYLALPEHAAVIAEWSRSRTGSPVDSPFVLDPTLGDVDLGFYNDPNVAAALRRWLLPMATGLTPNLFELALLSECPLSSLTRLEDVTAAARSLMTPQMQWIAVTGLRRTTVGNDSSRVGRIGELIITHDTTRILSRPVVPAAPAGVGDTFTASLISRLLSGHDLSQAVDAAAEYTAHQICREDRPTDSGVSRVETSCRRWTDT
ncbi:PfkB family carbohydrate kinase [Rhodococcus sp. RD6.2]|uniref:PfkB family carbohydrate kinase n=1 Tax=Rhodococcus sp. RD6.2 TaxID=260936 RepID=UPI00155D9BC2|nr:PfkB family carbohydrate kinase [Rhodococcus sp. RD6.2]